MSLRIAERAIHSIRAPTDIEILAENEKLMRRNGGPMAEQDRDLEEIELQSRETSPGQVPHDNYQNKNIRRSFHGDENGASREENGRYFPLASPIKSWWKFQKVAFYSFCELDKMNKQQS